MIVFNIDEKTVQQELDKATKEAIASAFSAYQVQSVIREQVADQLIGDVVKKSLQKAVKQIDIDALATAMAQQLAKSAVAVTHNALIEAVADMVIKLRDLRSYGEEGELNRKKVIAELRHNIETFNQEAR